MCIFCLQLILFHVLSVRPEAGRAGYIRKQHLANVQRYFIIKPEVQQR